MIYNFELKNGIRCILNKIEGVFSVSMGILVGAGSALETEKENGISHFIEHVNFKGTKKRTAFEISSDVDRLGAQINAFTSKEFTCYYIKSIGEHFAESFEILSDLFINSVYDSEELKKESGVIIEEINMYEDTPDEVCTDGLATAFYGDRGYGATILGSIENVSSFTRKDVLSYKEKYYTTDNIVISIAGAISLEEAKSACEQFMGDLKPSKKATAPRVNKDNLHGNFVSNKDIEQAHIAIAIPAPGLTSLSSDAYSIACGALGGGMSSRLFQTVREQMGLCYSIYSYVTSYLDCGFTSIYAGVGIKNYKSAFDAILSEMQKLKKDGITEEEFLRTREQIKSSFVMSQESTASQMVLFGKYLLLTGKDFDFNKKLEAINSLTKNDVNELILRDIEIDNIATSIVGKDILPLK